MPSVPATGGSGGSRPQRSEPSASGATPPCSSSIAEAGSWIASNPCRRKKGHSLHRLERTRILLQKRPGRGGVRRSGAASLPSAKAGLQHSRIPRSGSPGPGRSGVATSGAKTCEACGPSCSQRGTSPRWRSEDSASGPPCACERREATA